MCFGLVIDQYDKNCLGAKINHISLREDGLVFEFPKTESNQTWDSLAHGMCMPIQRSHGYDRICIDKQFICYPDIVSGDAPLFEDNS